MNRNYLRLFSSIAFVVVLFGQTLAQQSYTYTNCGATGSVGPTQTQVNNAYVATNLSGAVGTTSTGIQTWTVPYTGNYRIEARGAQGGNCVNAGALGATMIGDVALIGGEVLQILVGQMGDNGGNSSNPGGGGGGSFVVRLPYTTTVSALMIAGGGTGDGTYSSAPGLTTTAGGFGGVSGGANGTGGLGGIRGAGGGGFLTDGAPCSVSTTYASPGQAFVNGGRGGPVTNNTTCTSITTNGGFGGGSSHGGNCIPNGGAGGGFSGGGGSSNTVSGGGGSLNSGTNQVNTQGNNAGHGRVIITELCSVRISSSSSGSVNPVVLCSGNTITLTTDAVSNYSWSTGATTNSIVVAPNTNTVYSVSGTSSLNCTSVGVMSVIVSSGLPVLSISNPSTNICLGKTVSLTATGAITYTWANAGVVNGQTFTPSSTAVYTVSGQNGCGISTGTTAITISPLAVSALVTPTLVCQGYTAALTAVSSVGGYTWQPGAQVGASTIVAPTVNTIYTVTASDGTCSGTQTVALTTKTTPTILTSQAVSTICAGEALTLSASGAGTNGTYSWNPGGTGASITLSPPSSTAVTVYGTNSLNCTSSALQVILVNSPAPLTVGANKTIVCTGGTVALTGSSTSGVVFQWVNGPSTAGYTVSPTAALNIYTLNATQSTNTCVATQTIAIVAVIPNVSATSTLSVCLGGSVTFTASGATGYVWNGFNTGASGVYQVTPLVSAVYTLVANTNSTTVNCLTTKFATLTVFQNPTVTVTPGKQTICKGETHTLTASGASTYSWSGSTSTGSVITVKPTTNTTYTIIGVDANGCENTLLYTAKVSGCVGLQENSGQMGISIYPNPNAGEFVVSTSSDITLSIINSLGQELRKLVLTASNAHTVQVSDLSDGVYFIVGESTEGKVNQKIIIAK